jgi:acyl-CoA reductase-like NAD-dependent aldehyde dehydrogenase
MVLKPSPYTPLTTLLLGEIACDILPPGVLNILAGGNELGQWMTEHPDIDKITFTGSIATGKKVMASAAANTKRVTVELGGNDAAIVLGDVAPKEIARRIFQAAFANSGQVCQAIKRLYVHDDVYEALLAELAAIARQVKVGDGLEEGIDYGPLQNRMQYERVLEILDDSARQPGIRIVAGGHAMDRPGYFIEPTIVAGIAEGTRLVDEEPCGPVLPVLRFSDLDEAVTRANDSRFGLVGQYAPATLLKAPRLPHALKPALPGLITILVYPPTIRSAGSRSLESVAQMACSGSNGIWSRSSSFCPPVAKRTNGHGDPLMDAVCSPFEQTVQFR